jgi:hypothetical protein
MAIVSFRNENFIPNCQPSTRKREFETVKVAISKILSKIFMKLIEWMRVFVMNVEVIMAPLISATWKTESFCQ